MYACMHMYVCVAKYVECAFGEGEGMEKQLKGRIHWTEIHDDDDEVDRDDEDKKTKKKSSKKQGKQAVLPTPKVGRTYKNTYIPMPINIVHINTFISPHFSLYA